MALLRALLVVMEQLSALPLRRLLALRLAGQLMGSQLSRPPLSPLLRPPVPPAPTAKVVPDSVSFDDDSHRAP